MSGKRAKTLRRRVYGATWSPLHRDYTKIRPDGWACGTISADPRRQQYQRAKRLWVRTHRMTQEVSHE